MRWHYLLLWHNHLSYRHNIGNTPRKAERKWGVLRGIQLCSSFLSVCDLSMCFVSHQPGCWILMFGFHWNAAADRHPPQASHIIFFPVTTMHRANTGSFWINQMLHLYVEDSGGTKNKEKLQIKERSRRQLAENEMRDMGRLSEEPKVKLWFISQVHSSPSLHYL